MKNLSEGRDDARGSPEKYRERGTVAVNLSESLKALVLASLAPLVEPAISG